jgi:hypothetical protein
MKEATSLHFVQKKGRKIEALGLPDRAQLIFFIACDVLPFVVFWMQL